LGVVFGYGYTSILIAFGYSWQLTFNCLAFAMIICAILLSFVPKSLLNLDEIHQMKINEFQKRYGVKDLLPEMGGTGNQIAPF
jgi:hypothetical protein